MIRIVLFCLFFLNIILCKSQNLISEKERIINWKNNIQFDIYKSDDNKKTEKKEIIHFENATYPDVSTYLPYFEELIALPDNTYAEIEITDKVFIDIENSTLNQIKSLDKIKNEVVFTTYHSYIKRKPFIRFSLLPIRKNTNTGRFEKLVSFKIKIYQTRNNKSIQKSTVYKSNSVLASGKWYKFKVFSDGIYQITFAELAALGINNPQNVRIFGNSFGMLPFWNNEFKPDDLLENKIAIENNAIIFYAKGPTKWKYNNNKQMFEHTKHLYSDANYYFLTTDYNSGQDNAVKSQNSETIEANQFITSYNDYSVYELDSFNLIQSGRTWYGDHFDVQTVKSYDFQFPNILNNSNVKLKITVAGRAPAANYFQVTSENFSQKLIINPVSYNTTDYFANQTTEYFTFQTSADNKITVNLNYQKPTASSEGWLDYITVNAVRNLIFVNNQLQFRAIQSIGTDNVSEFKISNVLSPIKVWDVTEPTNPVEIIGTKSGTDYHFRLKTPYLKEFIAFGNESYLKPQLTGSDVGWIANQNLHALSNIDMIIVSPQQFIPYANEIAEIHKQNDKLNVLVVTQEQIFNEFSSGAADVSALKLFMKMLYDRSSNQNSPKYLLLFGDGSYNNKRKSPNNPNLILTYQSENSLNPSESFVTDDFYGFLDDNEGETEGLLDIGIGRFPVFNQEQASIAVKKIRNYISNNSYGDWRNIVSFIADDEDYNIHVNDADQLANYVDINYPIYNIHKIYLGTYQQITSASGQASPTANKAINDRIRRGSLIINYTGHANENWLAHEHILGIQDIMNWDNEYKLPIFVTATCEFSRFDNYDNEHDRAETSAGEYVFLNPKGGGIALLSSSRLVYSAPNYVLNKKFYEFVFSKNSQNENYTLGDITMLTKNNAGNSQNKLNFSLLGDPALKLAYPNFNIVTTVINEKNISEKFDTIKAYRKMTISGEIRNHLGQIENANGIVYPVVFDKKTTLKTLNTDLEGIFEYKLQNNIIYKGRADVKNGKFTFSFITPKDILYYLDYGKISYYADLKNTDACGLHSNILVGGSDLSIIKDKDGPSVDMFLNDKNFVSGGITDENPKLIAYVKDSSGVNTVGNGIGHDITLTIDNQFNQPVNLNDYYLADLNSFQSGKIEYVLTDLQEGNHQLKLKIWDVYNNSSENNIDFIVSKKENFSIDKLLNYPNPFTTRTWFYFTHNRPQTDLQVIIQILTVSGKLVKTIQSQMNTLGFKSEPIEWDGFDDYGNRIGRGVYIYRIKIKTSDNQIVEKYEKLLLLK